MPHAVMALMRTLFNFVIAGALLAVLLVSWFGPRVIAWDNTAGTGAAAMCLCAEQALSGAQKIIMYQMWGCASGAGLGLLLGIAFAVNRRKTPPPTPTSPVLPPAKPMS
jgi:hypothetical protein